MDMCENDLISVLLVEDDPGSRRFVEKTLSRGDRQIRYEVEFAGDLATATEMLRHKSFDNVLLDLQLPDSSGIKTIEAIRKINCEVPIVVLSATDDPKICLDAVSVGADYYLVKGEVTRDVLSRLILFVIEQRRNKNGTDPAVDELQRQNEILRSQLEQNKALLVERSDECDYTRKMLKRLRRDFFTIFDTVPAMIWYRDREGKVLRANKAAAESVALSPRDVAGRNYYELFSDGMDVARKKDEEVINTGQPRIGDIRESISSDGTPAFALVDRIPYYDDSGAIAGVIVFAQDITERKMADDKLFNAKVELEELNQHLGRAVSDARKSADEAIVANSAKSYFVAGVSHEIRTPINAVMGFADMLEDDMMTDEQKKCLRMIKVSAKNQLALTNDILDLSKIEAGKLDIEIISCPLSELIKEVLCLVSNEAASKGLELKVSASGDVPAVIDTDPVRFRQCLLNLTANAVKFTEHGHVHIGLNAEQKDGSTILRIDVEDTGIGIPDKHQQIIFDAFSQAEISTTRKFGGTGLGLAITSKLVRLMNGSIGLKSLPDIGSTFSIFLPIINDCNAERFNAEDVNIMFSDGNDEMPRPDDGGTVRCGFGPIYSELNNVSEYAELIGELAGKLPRIAANMRVAMESGDSELLMKFVNVLAGTGSSGGFPILTEKAEQLRKHVENENDEMTNKTVNELEDICSRIAQGCTAVNKG